jgi:cobalt/nickel transport system permease protein
MHIMEGFLPASHAAGWLAVSAPVFALGCRSLNRALREKPDAVLLLGAVAAFIFVMSALKLPSIGGSCSHPTGTGLGAIVFGPSIMAVLGSVVLLFQALMIAHGGITTLGANAFAMAIAGPWMAALLFSAGRRLRLPSAINIFIAAATANLFTYLVTATQLAMAFPDETGGFVGAWMKFLGVFAITQIPLAIMEGILTVLVIRALAAYRLEEIDNLLAPAGLQGAAP